MKPLLTQEIIRELLSYDPDSGIFTWKNRGAKYFKKGSKKHLIDTWNKKYPNKKAGMKTDDGYISIGILGHPYLAHRLVFLYMEGFLPEYDVDHINRIRDDNRLKNIRHVSKSCNSRNCSKRINNTSGVTGVSWHKAAKKWRSTIYVGGKHVSAGAYIDFKEAVEARWSAEVRYNFPNCNSTSEAYLYLNRQSFLE